MSTPANAIGVTTPGAVVFNGTIFVGETLPVPDGGTGVVTMTTAYAPVCAGTTATGNLQVASTGLATAGFVLTSNGAAALPSFQASGGGSAFTWSDKSTSFSAVTQNGYFVTATATATLPTGPVQGDTVKVVANTTDIVTITADAGDLIQLGAILSTSGGSVATTGTSGNSVTLVFNAALSTWYNVDAPQGVWTVTT
jgi:hypothetical protein